MRFHAERMAAKALAPSGQADTVSVQPPSPPDLWGFLKQAGIWIQLLASTEGKPEDSLGSVAGYNPRGTAQPFAHLGLWFHALYPKQAQTGQEQATSPDLASGRCDVQWGEKSSAAHIFQEEKHGPMLAQSKGVHADICKHSTCSRRSIPQPSQHRTVCLEQAEEPHCAPRPELGFVPSTWKTQETQPQP